MESSLAARAGGGADREGGQPQEVGRSLPSLPPHRGWCRQTAPPRGSPSVGGLTQGLCLASPSCPSSPRRGWGPGLGSLPASLSGRGCGNPQLRGCVLWGWEIPGELWSLGRKWPGAPPSLGKPGVCSEGPAVHAWP